MSKPVNPYTIGAFLVGSLTLLIAGVLIFGGGQFFKKKADYVIYFEGTLNGLNVGAPVTLQGVRIGAVKEISLELDKKFARLSKPVVIEIDPAVVLDSSGNPFQPASSFETRQKNADKLIAAGLRAQLQTQSLLTGLLYIECNFFPEQPAILRGGGYRGLTELPSIPTTVDQIKNTAEEMFTRFRKLPIEAIVNNLSITMNEVSGILTSDELKKNREALSKALNETEKLVANLNRNLGPLVNNMNGTLTDTRTMVRDFTRDMQPVLTSTDKALKEATSALNTATRVLHESKYTLSSVDALTAPDAPLWQSLDAVRDAAQSTRALADYLERNPNSIIFGKTE